MGAEGRLLSFELLSPTAQTHSSSLHMLFFPFPACPNEGEMLMSCVVSSLAQAWLLAPWAVSAASVPLTPSSLCHHSEVQFHRAHGALHR